LLAGTTDFNNSAYVMSDSPEERVNFQQLKIIREAARQDYNLTEVANMLYTSQSGVSRHIRELEEELGIEILSAAANVCWG
jgi:LysR family cys regulon transcriptional activator